jgi:hypothetical protein
MTRRLYGVTTPNEQVTRNGTRDREDREGKPGGNPGRKPGETRETRDTDLTCTPKMRQRK